MKSVTQQLLIAGLLSSASLISLAQTQPVSPPASQPGAGAHHMGHGDPAHRQHRMAEHHGKHLANLKAKLKLNATQETSWTSFAAAMQPPGDMKARHAERQQQRAELDKLSTPERIDKMRAQRTERMAQMNTAMTQREDAVKTFYATLTGEQKKVFDAEHMRHVHGHAGKPRMGHDHHAHGLERPSN